MKILHVGGYHFVTMNLARAQIAAGHEVTIIGTLGNEYVFEMPFACVEAKRKAIELATEKYDIIHFHRSESICDFHGFDAEGIEPTLELLRSSGATLVFYSYGQDPLGRADGRKLLGISHGIFKSYFKHVFIGDIDSYELTSISPAWSWLSLGVDLSSIPRPTPREPRAHELKILHIPYRLPPRETQAILTAINALKDGPLKFHFTLLPPEEIKDLPTLRQKLKDCDLLIEHLGRKSFGILAIEALAHGVTVLSGNSSEGFPLWEQLQICPVLDTNSQNLAKRLQSIIREPKCLRDLGKRSRLYVEQFHDSQIVQKQVAEIYQRLLDQ